MSIVTFATQTCKIELSPQLLYYLAGMEMGGTHVELLGQRQDGKSTAIAIKTVYEAVENGCSSMVIAFNKKDIEYLIMKCMDFMSESVLKTSVIKADQITFEDGSEIKFVSSCADLEALQHGTHICKYDYLFCDNFDFFENDKVDIILKKFRPALTRYSLSLEHKGSIVYKSKLLNKREEILKEIHSTYETGISEIMKIEKEIQALKEMVVFQFENAEKHAYMTLLKDAKEKIEFLKDRREKIKFYLN